MDIADLVLPVVIAFALYWPVVAVAAILVVGPLLGFVIVGAIGAVRTALARPQADDEDATDELFDTFEALREEPAARF